MTRRWCRRSWNTCPAWLGKRPDGTLPKVSGIASNRVRMTAQGIVSIAIRGGA
jgi:hypothetical protein